MQQLVHSTWQTTPEIKIDFDVEHKLHSPIINSIFSEYTSCCKLMSTYSRQSRLLEKENEMYTIEQAYDIINSISESKDFKHVKKRADLLANSLRHLLEGSEADEIVHYFLVAEHHLITDDQCLKMERPTDKAISRLLSQPKSEERDTQIASHLADILRTDETKLVNASSGCLKRQSVMAICTKSLVLVLISDNCTVKEFAHDIGIFAGKPCVFMLHMKNRWLRCSAVKQIHGATTQGECRKAAERVPLGI